MDDCIFCKIAQGEIPSKIAYQDDALLAFYDINPAAPTHIVIIPREHIANAAALSEAQALLVGKLILAATQVARDLKIDASGYRIVANNGKDGGQTVGHLHFHLLGGRPMTWPPG